MDLDLYPGWKDLFCHLSMGKSVNQRGRAITLDTVLELSGKRANILLGFVSRCSQLNQPLTGCCFCDCQSSSDKELVSWPIPANFVSELQSKGEIRR